MLSRRVLIIEDDADAAGVLEAYLRRENYDVTITGDGHSGLDMAQRWKPDLILLDVMLPGLNGTEVLAGLRRKSDVPVIMVTAMGDTPDRIGALRGWPPITRAEFEAETTDGSMYVGSPETVAHRIARAIAATGVERFDLIYSAGAQSASSRLRAVELYGTHVIPMVRDMLSSTNEAILDGGARV